MTEPYWTSADGRHTLYYGKAEEVLPTLETVSVDAVITDPPYFRAYLEGERQHNQRSSKGAPAMRILHHRPRPQAQQRREARQHQRCGCALTSVATITLTLPDRRGAYEVYQAWRCLQCGWEQTATSLTNVHGPLAPYEALVVIAQEDRP
jgi:hypothetical protein